MATISNTMAINDQMSPALNAIANALAACISAFDQMQAVSGQAVNTSNIQAANQALAQTETQADAAAQSIEDGRAATQAATQAAQQQAQTQADVTDNIQEATNALEQTENAQDEVNQSLQEGSNAADQLWGKLKGLIAAYVGWQTVKQTVEWSDQITNINARLDIINDKMQTTKELQAMIMASANRTYSSYMDTANAVSQMGMAAGNAFQNNQELIGFVEQLNKQFVIGGVAAEQQASVLFNMTQALSQGVLRGQDLNSVIQNMPAVARAIEQYLGATPGSIKELGEQGKITADVLKNAVMSVADDTNKKFNDMPNTFADVWNKTKNTMIAGMFSLQKTIEETINSERFKAMMDGIASAFNSFISIVGVGIKWTVGLVGFLYDNWSLIAPVIGTVVAALTIYRAVMLGINAVEIISKGIKLAGVVASYAKAAATGVEVAATTAATAAQWGLNTAMLASPVTWIIAAIIAIVGLLYLAIAVINKVTGESYSATGIIAAVVWGLWAYIKNIIAAVWNTLLSLAEFFINVWTNPVYSVKKLIYSLAEVFAGFFGGILKGLDPVITGLAKGFLWAVNKGIQAINWLSEAMDAIGLGWGQMGELKMEGTVASNAEKLASDMLASINPGEAPEGYVSLDKYKMDFADPAAYAAKGYEAGAAFAEDPMGAIKDALGLSEDPAIKALLNGQQKQLGAMKETAKNTTPKGEEDYKYLKEIMAGRAIDRLSGTDIKIEMTNNNKIDSALDINSIVDALTQKLTGAMNTAAEGVHV